MVKYELGYVKGADGRGIVSIEKTDTSGLIDTYTITYTDGTTSTYVVKNGEDGSAITIDTELSSSSTNPVQNKVIKTALDTKSNSSHNHDSRYYTETEMDTKLGGKANTTHTHNISDVSNLQSTLNNKANTNDLGAVAFSNSYADLDDIPSTFPPRSHTHTKSQITDFPTVVDNLNSTSSTNVLSARQGKVLNDLIGTAIQYINQ